MNTLNKYCPRSGKPVREDSLTEYRGFTVGFCNQGCRDDFASNTEDRPDDRQYFDTLIKERDLEPSPEQAKSDDRSAVVQLLKSCDLPFEDLTDDHLKHFFLMKKDSKMVGTIGLEIYKEYGLLRSLAVREEYRSYGFGKKLVHKIESYAREQGIGTMYLLTTTADGFFGRRGYTAISRDAVPGSIRESEEFAALCPSSAAVMKKML